MHQECDLRTEIWLNLPEFSNPVKPGVPRWEPRNKIMRIGLHGLCGYIKLERGRIGGADGAIAAQRSPDEQA
jgi:hypothetical protein